MVKQPYPIRADRFDRRDKSQKVFGDTLVQRREQSELDEARAVVQTLEQQLERARAGTGVKKVVLESGTSPQISALVEQLDSERKKVSCRDASGSAEVRAHLLAPLSDLSPRN